MEFVLSVSWLALQRRRVCAAIFWEITKSHRFASYSLLPSSLETRSPYLIIKRRSGKCKHVRKSSLVIANGEPMPGQKNLNPSRLLIFTLVSGEEVQPKVCPH